MSALDRLKIDEPFDNFDDDLKFVESLTNEHFMPFRITDSKTIEKYNDNSTRFGKNRFFLQEFLIYLYQFL
jgi:hypothetical protein